MCNRVKTSLENKFTDTDKKVSFVSPFKNQAKILENFVVSDTNNIMLRNGTVHTIQGHTTDILIASIAATEYSVFLTPPLSWVAGLNANLQRIFDKLLRDARRVRNRYDLDLRPVLNDIEPIWEAELRQYIGRNTEREFLEMTTTKGFEQDILPGDNMYRFNRFAPNLFNVLLSRPRSAIILLAHRTMFKTNIILKLIKMWFDTYKSYCG
jgi:hypothetical protein